MRHELKIDPQHFAPVASNHKRFEMRNNDRNFQEGDLLALRETTNSAAEMATGAPLSYTGKKCHRYVTHVFPCADIGLDLFVILSIRPMTNAEREALLRYNEATAEPRA